MFEHRVTQPAVRAATYAELPLRYDGFDVQGQAFSRMVGGFHARVVQHECDHLQGMLYPRRVRDLTRFGFAEELLPDLPVPV